MNDGDALHAAILARPEEDTPRLAYADWLDENATSDAAHAHATFIRLHIEWDRRPTDAPPNESLKHRLIAAWQASNLLAKSLIGDLPHVYHRGFLAGVQFGDDRVRERVEAAFSVAPIRMADFYLTGESDAEWLAGSPLLTRLAGLSCEGATGIVGRVVASPYLANLDLVHLEVPYPDEPAAARFVASGGHLRNLTVLDFDGSQIENDGLMALASAGHLGTVRKLTVRSDNRTSHFLGESGIRALINSQSLTGLTHLGFCDCQLDGPALLQLLRWKGLSGLTELDLSFTDLQGEDIVTLAQCRQLKNLRRLCLDAFSLTDESVNALASAPWLPALRQLWIEAREEYGDGEDQTVGLLDGLAERLGARLVMPAKGELAFLLSPVGEADQIWQRLRRHRYRDEDALGLLRIL
ncbi:Repeat-companion domain protein OS=Isosphaera pallida (strain ATCC 43644 / DSM 9630 / IS1B) GN=Isop_0507 PE=4 SV=1: LRR_6: LRR_6 [Gemmata massiliana]|uniref:Repeat-companion domain protein n=1 Tax=Gemmata massiliana TaxID=1210884 RepID=A0A6P2CTM8_9BACT|nr:TIGR02996 domain-containing protein [Gemmata massiliana]VTR91736.1 Repeat-companion domain protein OS=Isosphaera pallida (strain ATCC 43644 / DSM 9630 / IS1B) GN=Isop_0507 PE=4 SV=1: LRR_6: LRR_6 [Gemmata massiliana]